MASISDSMSSSCIDRPLAKQGAFQADLARARIEVEAARFLVLAAAAALDRCG